MATKATTNTWGGKRLGAGRKPKLNKRKRLNTTIENATAGWLKEWRERDNLSQGLVIDNVIAWALAQGWQPFNKS